MLRAERFSLRPQSQLGMVRELRQRRRSLLTCQLFIQATGNRMKGSKPKIASTIWSVSLRAAGKSLVKGTDKSLSCVARRYTLVSSGFLVYERRRVLDRDHFCFVLGSKLLVCIRSARDVLQLRVHLLLFAKYH